MRLDESEKSLTEEVFEILDTFLKQSNSIGLSDLKPDRESDDNSLTWLGWTVVNGSAEDVVVLIKSKSEPDGARLVADPLMGMSKLKRGETV